MTVITTTFIQNNLLDKASDFEIKVVANKAIGKKRKEFIYKNLFKDNTDDVVKLCVGSDKIFSSFMAYDNLQEDIINKIINSPDLDSHTIKHVIEYVVCNDIDIPMTEEFIDVIKDNEEIMRTLAINNKCKITDNIFSADLIRMQILQYDQPQANLETYFLDKIITPGGATLLVSEFKKLNDYYLTKMLPMCIKNSLLFPLLLTSPAISLDRLKSLNVAENIYTQCVFEKSFVNCFDKIDYLIIEYIYKTYNAKISIDDKFKDILIPSLVELTKQQNIGNMSQKNLTMICLISINHFSDPTLNLMKSLFSSVIQYISDHVSNNNASDSTIIKIINILNLKNDLNTDMLLKYIEITGDINSSDIEKLADSDKFINPLVINYVDNNIASIDEASLVKFLQKISLDPVQKVSYYDRISSRIKDIDVKYVNAIAAVCPDVLAYVYNKHCAHTIKSVEDCGLSTCKPTINDDEITYDHIMKLINIGGNDYQELFKCKICFVATINVALNCGHMFCGECCNLIKNSNKDNCSYSSYSSYSSSSHVCPICRVKITTETKLFF